MGGLFLTASELNINQDRGCRQTLCAGQAELLLTLLGAAGSPGLTLLSPALRWGIPAHKHLPCLQGGIRPCTRCTLPSWQPPASFRCKVTTALSGAVRVAFTTLAGSTASCDAIPVPRHPDCPEQALPFASSSSTFTISRGPLKPARIIACNYSCCAVSSEASLGRIAALLPIPSGHLKLTAASSESSQPLCPAPGCHAHNSGTLSPAGSLAAGMQSSPCYGPPPRTAPTESQQRPHTFCKNQRWM